jgi:GNAT superfamily N-acetyltransferase
MGTGCVADWQSRVSAPVLKENPVNAFLNNPISHEHDIDPSTGELLPATPYPSTLLAEEEPDGNEFGKETTSNHQITREISVRERLAESLRIRRQQRKEILNPGPEPEPAWPSVDCTLRPAAEKDFEQIAEIINSERREETCPQVMGSKSVTARDIRGIFGHCRSNLRPFIVACVEEEDFLDRSKWPKGSEKVYQEYVRLKKSRPAGPSALVGFAFVAEARPGFSNRPCPGSRFTGQVRLIVHPQHRRKGCGTALLDRILLSVAPYHRGLIDYTWRCDEPSMIYELPTAAHNRRQYTHVFIENLSRRDAEMPWKRKLLEKFDFKPAACFEETVRTDRGCDSTWLDLEIWQHKTTYRVLDDQPGEYLTPK